MSDLEAAGIIFIAENGEGTGGTACSDRRSIWSHQEVTASGGGGWARPADVNALTQLTADSARRRVRPPPSICITRAHEGEWLSEKSDIAASSVPNR